MDTKQVHRGQFGRWVFCLVELNHRDFPGKLKLHEVSDCTNESAARIYFNKYLELGNYYLVKMPEVTAHIMKHETNRT